MASPIIPGPQRAEPPSPHPTSTSSSTSSRKSRYQVELVRSHVATAFHGLIFTIILAFTSYCWFDLGKRINYSPMLRSLPGTYWTAVTVEAIGLAVLAGLSMFIFLRPRTGFTLTSILTIVIAAFLIALAYFYGTGLACVLWPSILSIVQAALVLPKGKHSLRPFVEEHMLPL